jgi:DNA ligase-1
MKYGADEFHPQQTITKHIYKKDTSGNIRFLTVRVEGADLVQISGVVGTDNPVEHRKTCKAKNVGRSNETTPEQQALLEFESKWKNKLSEGYFESEGEAKASAVLLPMLAKSYEKEAKKIKWDGNVYVQPKLDGMRSIHTGGGNLISRKGKIIDTMPHIITDLSQINGKLDGELYAHGLNFQDNMKLIKKYREGESELIKFHTYDIVETLPFAERYALLEKLAKDSQHIIVVPTFEIKSEEELKKYHAKFLEDGYEGSIVRHGEAPYKVKSRSSNLLKYKDFVDIAVPLVDVIPANQRTTWGVPVLALPDGRTFEAGARLSHAEREDLLANKDKYIGKTAEIRFFEYYESGMPRFPVLVGFRLDK